MFNKIINYFTYRKIIKQNLPTLKSRYNLKFDHVYGRLGTMYNLPVDLHEDVNKYGYKFLDEQVTKYINSLQIYFWKIGIGELISLRQTDMIDSVNVKIVFRYKYFNHQIFLYIVLALLGVIIGGVLIGGLLKLILFLITILF
jgi:hypothetical protein